MPPAVEVSRLTVHRGHVEAPDAPSYALVIDGDLPAGSDDAAVEARAGGSVVAEGASIGGGRFRVVVDTLTLPAEFELEILVSGEPTATLAGRRAVMRPAPRGSLAPVLVTTIGRTGSSWLVRLLGRHPAIVAHRPFEVEPRAVAYWTEVLCALSQPAAQWQLLARSGTEDWWLGRGSRTEHLGWADPETRAVLGLETVDDLSSLAHRRVERFYRTTARATAAAGEGDPSAFVEKATPREWNRLPLIGELFPRSRSLLLVRDLRDVLTSILAFNEKQTVVGFQRAAMRDGEEWVRELAGLGDRMRGLLDREDGRTRLVRYEDLIGEPERTLAAVLEWLGLDARPEVVAATLASALEDTPQMREHRTAASPEASIGRWRHDLPPPLREASTRAFADVLAAFGYEA